MKTLRIACGAGFADDRIQYGIDLVNYGEIDYIVFECLAERTIAEAQMAKVKNPELGYNKWLKYRIDPILKKAKEKKIKIITNMGAANPLGATKKIIEIARNQGISNLKIATVTGDDVLEKVRKLDPIILENGKKVSELGFEKTVSANAYLGSSPIVQALSNGADIVITGRVADPSLFLSPIIYEYNIAPDNWNLLGKGTCAGHLMECGTYVTGSYFADPGVKDVKGLDSVSPPICEFEKNGDFVLTKLPNSGGEISTRTCSEQILYEVHDPTKYITPDVIADFSRVKFDQIEKDKVKVTGASGNHKTNTLKVAIGYNDSTVITGQVSYAGFGCVDRAKLTAEVALKRLKRFNMPITEEKIDIIGYNSVFEENFYPNYVIPNEVRLRVAVRTNTNDENTIAFILNEIRAVVGHNGSASYGGSEWDVKKIIAIKSTLIPRDMIEHRIHFMEV